MNRGEIPGYYYDQVKKKYFKIQANHLAPRDAKYAKSNVELEKRDQRKRKFDEKQQERLRKQTVPAARLLQHPLLGGSGLCREHGNRTHASYHVARQTTFVQGLVSDKVEVVLEGFDSRSTRISDVHYLEETSQLLLSISHSEGSHCIYAWDQKPDWSGRQTFAATRPIHAFHDPVIVTIPVNISGHNEVIACTAHPNLSNGNVFVGRMPDPDDDCGLHSGWQFNMGKPGDTLYDCKLNAQRQQVAFAGTNGAQVHHLGAHMTSLTQLSAQGTAEAFACEWLDSHTLAVGLRQRKTGIAYHDVYLWDIRTDGVTSRIACDSRIIGLCRPDHSGWNLLVADNRTIGLHDLRTMGSKRLDFGDANAIQELRNQPPVLTFNHLSGSTHLDMAIYNGDILAAMDHVNRLHTYSLRTGGHLRSFNAQPVTHRMSKPRWQEDRWGRPYLSACAGNTIQQWSWTGAGT